MTDFDSGLLHSSFEPITGSPEEKYDKWSQRLSNYASRLYLLKSSNGNDNKFDKIIGEIEKYFTDDTLPKITTKVNDYSEREGRIINLVRDDFDDAGSCPDDPQIFSKTIETIREEQYFKKISQIKLLIAKARGLLDDKVFNWHRDDLIEEITPGMEDNNGGTAKSEQDNNQC